MHCPDDTHESGHRLATRYDGRPIATTARPPLPSGAIRRRTFSVRTGPWPVLLVLALVVTAGVTEAALTRVKPARHGGRVKVLVGESKKSSTYHKATAAKPIEATINGPVTLRVLGRNMNPRKGEEPLRLRIEVDGAEAWVLQLPARTARSASLSSGKRLGVLRRVEIKIPGGAHQVRLIPADDASTALVRVFTGEQSRPKTAWIPFAPERFSRALILRGEDSETTYYRFTSETPLGITVYNGPMRLKVKTRIEFDETAGYTQSYVVNVNLDGKPWKSFSLKSRASHTLTYPDLPEVTPGMSREFTISVPSGTHHVSFHLNGTTAEGATARIYAPRKELNAANRS